MNKINDDKIKALFGIVASILGIIAAIVKFDNSILCWVSIGLFGVLLIGVIIYYLMNEKKRMRGKSGASVVAISSLYINKLLSLVHLIDKKLSKHVQKGSIRSIDEALKDLLNHEQNVKQEKKDKEKRDKYIPNYKKFRFELIQTAKLINDDAKNTNDYQALYDEAQTLCKDIMSLERTLLQLEQHKTRIKLGEFVIKYSCDKEDIIKAYTDLIGFTYILDGKFYEAEATIKQAIRILDFDIDTIREEVDNKNNNSNSNHYPDHYYDCLLLKARALRHLSTTYYTYQYNRKEEENNKSFKNFKSYLDQGYRILEDIDFKNHYKIDKGPKVLVYDARYLNMKFGFDTNKILYQFYNFYLENEESGLFNYQDCLKLINDDLSLLEMMDKLHYHFDRHRYMKLEALKIQLLRILNERNIQIDNKNKNNSNNNNSNNNNSNIVINDIYSKNNIEQEFEKIEEIIKKNIYFDDALEMYSNEKIHYCYYKADRIINKYNYKVNNKDNNKNINKDVHKNVNNNKPINNNNSNSNSNRANDNVNKPVVNKDNNVNSNNNNNNINKNKQNNGNKPVNQNNQNKSNNKNNNQPNQNNKVKQDVKPKQEKVVVQEKKENKE